MLLMLLEYVPVYFRNLSRWRPSAAASTRKSTKSEDLVVTMARILETGQMAGGRPAAWRSQSTDDRIPRMLDEAHADLTGWAVALADDRPELARVVDRILAMEPERCVRLLCALLTKRVATLTTLPWVRDLVQGVVTMERRLRYETERSVPGWYAGSCRQCGIGTYVVPGLTWVTCQGCGMSTAARDHLEVILDEARTWVARPMRLAEALVALLDTEQSVPRLYERIHKWGQRERITPVRRTTRGYAWDDTAMRVVVVDHQVGYARYRMGEVLDVLLAEGATRLTGAQESTCA
jgi:hypothetical protein